MHRLITFAIATVLVVAAFGSASIGEAVAAQATHIDPAAVPGTLIVDDLSAGFRRVGSGWHSALAGYDNHHYWVRASRRLNRVGIWTATLDEPGLYRVLVKLPRWHAGSRKAVYKVKTADGWAKRVRNQYKSRGTWLSLGIHALTTQAEVRLGDKTLDPRGTGRKVAFDAVTFIPVAAPDPPVITNLDVEPRHDRAIVTFSLTAAGTAKTEYRLAGADDWTVGADETSSKDAERRQVIKGLVPETDYELRVLATNAGGKTISAIKPFRTLAPPPPVIGDLQVKADDTRAIVTFSLDAAGPARSEYREPGDVTWTIGADETSSKYADHRQVIKGLVPETDYELRVSATNASGTTISDVVGFNTKPRLVDCDGGGDLQAAIDQSRKGDTIIIEGTCRGRYRIASGDLTLKGRMGAVLKGNGTGALLTYGEFDPGKTLRVVGLRIEDGRTGVFCGSFKRCEFEDATIAGNGIGLDTAQGTSIIVRDSVLHHNGVAVNGQYQGGVELSGSVVRDNGMGISADSAEIEDSTIKDNGPHGGISARWLMLRRSKVLRNSSDRGGGILVDYGGLDSLATIEDSVIRGNSATNTGGGIWLKTTEPGASSLKTVVISGNVAAVDGGGLYLTGEKPTLTDVTFSDNQPNACSGCQD